MEALQAGIDLDSLLQGDCLTRACLLTHLLVVTGIVPAQKPKHHLAII